MDLSQKTIRIILYCPDLGQLSSFVDFIYDAVSENKRSSHSASKRCRTEILYFRIQILATGFLYLWSDLYFNDDIHCSVHGGVWQAFLRMGVPTDHIHGIGFQEDRILD